MNYLHLLCTGCHSQKNRNASFFISYVQRNSVIKLNYRMVGLHQYPNYIALLLWKYCDEIITYARQRCRKKYWNSNNMHTVSQNALTLASCGFGKHGLILIFFLHTASAHLQKWRVCSTSLVLHFYLIYLLSYSRDENYAMLMSLNVCKQWCPTRRTTL